MHINHLHDWNLTIAEAQKLQRELAARIDVTTPLPPYQTIAAADVSYNKYDPLLHAAVVVVEAGTLRVIERAGTSMRVQFPYIPGYLSFREVPPLVEAFRRLDTVPDIVLCDGQGIAHPRRLGLACHLGLWLDLPTVGCAKSRLTGTYVEPGPHKGDRAPLLDRNEIIGTVLRSRDRTKPLYVSPGHRCDMESAVELVLATLTRTRLPDPARWAHDYVNELRRGS